MVGGREHERQAFLSIQAQDFIEERRWACSQEPSSNS